MESLSHDFSKLLDEGSNHDVEFIVGDQTIKAHKNILCSRSDVFASMLQSDMVEGKTGRVYIQDMDAIIFRQFLRCLYTGLLPELTIDIAFHFYEASDKYGVDSVKKQCADFLTDNLSPENACEILVLSDRHSDEFQEKCHGICDQGKNTIHGSKMERFLSRKFEVSCRGVQFILRAISF